MQRVLRAATFLVAGCIAGWSTAGASVAWADTASGDALLAAGGNASGPTAAIAGSQCSTADECGSGFCVGGVCCNTACDSPCEACNVPGAEGTCSLLLGTLLGGGTSACSSVPSTPPGDGSTPADDAGSLLSPALELAPPRPVVSGLPYPLVRDGGIESDGSESPDESGGCASIDGLTLLALLAPGLLLARRRTR